MSITKKKSTSAPEATSYRPAISDKGTRPWHQHITIDTIAYILSRSIFHPAIVYIFWLCIASVHRHKLPLATYVLYWCGLMIVVAALRWGNAKITYGGRRKVNWEKEVVVVTGGASGLGRLIAEIYALRGVSVAVLDVKAADKEAEEMIEGGSLAWYQCDVSKKVEVDKAMIYIRKELGAPSVLVNNAAGPISGLLLGGSCDSAKLSTQQADKTLAINLAAHFYTLSQFLWGSLMSSSTSNGDVAPGATIVTISSILSHLAPAGISDYAASKAAVSSLHHTLTHELRKSRLDDRIKTVLVEVGQMDTALFAKVETPWYANFFGPVLEAKDVAKEIVGLIDRGESGLVRMPFYAKLIPWYGVMPGSLQMLVRRFAGIDQAVVP